MTTPTREQALTPAELRELFASFSAEQQAMFNRAVNAAHTSGLELGRDQGLREAKEVCEAMHDEDRPGDYVAAIEQLEVK